MCWESLPLREKNPLDCCSSSSGEILPKISEGILRIKQKTKIDLIITPS